MFYKIFFGSENSRSYVREEKEREGGRRDGPLVPRPSRPKGVTDRTHEGQARQLQLTTKDARDVCGFNASKSALSKVLITLISQI